ncbi:MAG: hypothetical protein EU536_01020 [Promethearchaeota archaeon]|nr:MAG: hypothetical protein EU536_01020 [Candidatus Lokiarchaeota archaeon]
MHEEQSLRGILAGKFDSDEFEKILKELRGQWRLRLNEEMYCRHYCFGWVFRNKIQPLIFSGAT